MIPVINNDPSVFIALMNLLSRTGVISEEDSNGVIDTMAYGSTFESTASAIDGIHKKRPVVKCKALDERCKPECHGDLWDLKFYELGHVYEPKHFNCFTSVTCESCGGFGCSECDEGVVQRFAQIQNVEQDEQGGISYKKGAIFKVSLGVAMELPEGCRADAVSRSSTQKHFGATLTNAVGKIDEAYKGDDDIWFAEFVALRDGSMKIGDRILQFELVKKNEFRIEYVDRLDNDNRGGHGSTGR